MRSGVVLSLVFWSLACAGPIDIACCKWRHRQRVSVCCYVFSSRSAANVWLMQNESLVAEPSSHCYDVAVANVGKLIGHWRPSMEAMSARQVCLVCSSTNKECKPSTDLDRIVIGASCCQPFSSERVE